MMNDWTAADERTFLAMKDRREKILTARMDRLKAAVAQLPRGQALEVSLAGHADAIRDALEPFDSGVRAASQPAPSFNESNSR